MSEPWEQSSTFTSSTTVAERVDRREWHVGRLEVTVGTSFVFHEWPHVWSSLREEIVICFNWRRRYLAVCWLRA